MKHVDLNPRPAAATQVLSSHVHELTAQIEGDARRRDMLVAEMRDIDNNIEACANKKADLLTAIARIEGSGRTHMRTQGNLRPASEPYLPNPFTAAPEHRVVSDKQGHLLEAADQIGGMEFLDDDLRIVGFTTGGLLKFLAALGVEGAA